MKKIKTLTTGFATSLLLFSCSGESQQSGIVDNSPKNVSFSIELPGLTHTKAVGDLATNGSKVKLEGELKVYAKQGAEGATVNTFTLAASDFFGTDGVSKAKTLEVNGTATYIFVEGNIDNTTKTDDVNTRQGIATSSAVRVTGGNRISAGSDGANSTCSVELSPEMARFEVLGSLGNTTKLTNLLINGIYLNNVKQKRADATLVKSTNESTPSWSTVYASSGVKSNLGSIFSTPINKFESNKADGYNFFPQGADVAPTSKEEALKTHPHIIINVSYTQGSTTVTNKWLNVVAFKAEGGSYFQNFEKGKVYQLNLADVKDIIDVVNPPVTNDPDPDAVSVDITVSVKGWDIVVAKPEV